MMVPYILHPKSRGRLTLSSTNPLDHPILYHNYFTEPEDMDIIVKGIKLAIQLINTTAFQRHGAELYTVALPPCKEHEFGSYAYWECSVRYMTFTIYHQSCTCKMGPDTEEDAVVNPKLQVRGVNNFRVVDASIMTDVISGHTVAACYMIAEKAADMIKNEWNVST
jgi:choline dehydrogenase-like flavoprotein